MDKNLLGMYDLKIERLKKALERNNMTCNVFNTEEELHDYFQGPKGSGSRWFYVT